MPGMEEVIDAVSRSKMPENGLSVKGVFVAVCQLLAV